MIKHYVTQEGQYIGAFDGVEPPAGAVEVQTAPRSAADTWDGQQWIEAEDPVPESVSMRQARLALHDAGLLDSVQTAIDSLAEPDKTRAQIEWDYASSVERSGTITQMLAAQMGLTGEEVDQLFKTAAGL